MGWDGHERDDGITVELILGAWDVVSPDGGILSPRDFDSPELARDWADQWIRHQSAPHLERAVGEVELALRGEEPSPSWGPLAQAVAALRRSGDDCADCRWRRGCPPPHLGLGSRTQRVTVEPEPWAPCEACETPGGCRGVQACVAGR